MRGDADQEISAEGAADNSCFKGARGEMAAVCACRARDIGAVVDENARHRASRDLYAAPGQFIKRARCEIFFAELDERNACADRRVCERENVLEITTGRSAGRSRCAARNRVDNRLLQFERHCSVEPEKFWGHLQAHERSGGNA